MKGTEVRRYASMRSVASYRLGIGAEKMRSKQHYSKLIGIMAWRFGTLAKI
jgi:hypothetical protein